jgi:uncharacterized protein YuzE
MYADEFSNDIFSFRKEVNDKLDALNAKYKSDGGIRLYIRRDGKVYGVEIFNTLNDVNTAHFIEGMSGEIAMMLSGKPYKEISNILDVLRERVLENMINSKTTT